MGNCISDTVEGILTGLGIQSPNALALLAISKNDEKDLLQVLNMRGVQRVRVNEKDPENGGYTLLAIAAEKGSNKCVKVLIEKGRANPDIPNDAGFVPLTLALKHGHDGTALILVNAGANTECADMANGKTALLWAVERGSATTIRTLAEKGADLEAKSRASLTALMTAADMNNADIVRVLLNAGANPKTQDMTAGTALSRARDKHHTLVAQLLENSIKGTTGGSSPEGKGDSREGAAKKKNPLAKGALGSQVADVFSTGRAQGLEKDTKERTKDVKYKAVGLDSALNSNPGSGRK